LLKNFRSVFLLCVTVFAALLSARAHGAELPVGSSFKIEGESSEARFKEIEVTSVESVDGSLSAEIASGIASDKAAEKVSILSLQAAGAAEDSAASAETKQLQTILEGAAPEVRVDKKEVKVELSPDEIKSHPSLVKYQQKYARPIWTIFKCTTYALASWYLVLRTSGHFDFWSPLVIVAFGAFCAWKVEAINSKIENFKPVYTLLNKNKNAADVSLARKLASAVARLVEPAVATAAFETVLYFSILEYQQLRNSAMLGGAYEHIGALAILGKSASYGMKAFFSDYSLALAIQKIVSRSNRSTLFKHMFTFHTATALAIATFMGNFLHNSGISWAAPTMLVLTTVGTLAYTYLKLPVIKSLLGGIAQFVPRFRESETFGRWLNDYDLSKDFMADFPPLESVDEDTKITARKSSTKISCVSRIRSLLIGN
jgi:hypothetical protein